MLADELDYVVGVDTHLDEHVLAVVAAPSGAVLARRAVRANARGYAAALGFAREAAGGSRVWAVEALAATAPVLRVTSLAAARRCSRSAVLHVPSGVCAAKTTRSTRRGRRGQRWPAKRSLVRAAEHAARRCGCFWLRGAAPSTCAAKRSVNCVA